MRPQAEAQITGELAVCAGSCGPGNLHLINGLFDAHRSRTPVLAIAAQIPSAEIGGGYFQETHPQDLFRECSHYCELVSDPAQLPYVLENAIRAAVGTARRCRHRHPRRRRVASSAEARHLAECRLLPAAPIVRPAEGELEALAKLLNGAKRVTLFCGRGCAGAHDGLMRLAETLKSPIVHALGGKEHVEFDNPYDVGMTGFIGFSSGYAAMHALRRAADARDRFSLQAVSADGREDRAGRHPAGESRPPLQARPRPCRRRRRHDRGAAAETEGEDRPQASRRQPGPLQEGPRRARRTRAGHAGQKPIHPQYLARLLSEQASQDAVFTADVGTPTIWAARYLAMNGRRRLIGSLGSRLDGQRHGARHRRAGRAAGAAGDLDVGRWRVLPC